MPPRRVASDIWDVVSKKISDEYPDRPYTVKKDQVINAVKNARAELNAGFEFDLENAPWNQISLEDARICIDFRLNFRVGEGDYFILPN